MILIAPICFLILMLFLVPLLLGTYISSDRLFKADVMTLAKEWNKDLPESGVLTGIMLHMRGKNGAALHNRKMMRIIDHITKIQITNGSNQYIYSLSGYQAKFLHWIQQHQIAPEQAILYGAKNQWTSLLIPFGRFYGDELYALDLSRFDDLKIAITNDAVAAEIQTGELKVDVELYYMNELKSTPAKYLKNYEWDSDVASADTEWIDQKLPTTEKMRLFWHMMHPDLGTYGNITADPVSDSYTYKLWHKEKSKLVMEARIKDILRMNELYFGPTVSFQRTPPSTTYYRDLLLTYVHSTNFSHVGDSDGAATDILTMEDENGRCQKFRKVTGVDIVNILARGMGYYHGFVPQPSMMNLPEAEWLDGSRTGGKGPVRIDWYAHKDDHEFETCVQSAKMQGET